MNVQNHRAWASLTLASYLLAIAVAVLHDHHHHVDQHGHSSALSSVCQHDSATLHCHLDEGPRHDHRSENDHPRVPAKHDDCLICQYLSNKPLPAPSVTVAQLVEQVIPVESLPLAQPSDVFLSGYDCRGPPGVG